MRRREFITLTGGLAVGWPLVAYTQPVASPVIGFLDPRTPEVVAARLRGFRQGLKESGYVEGENVTIAFGWGEDQIDRLPSLATDLVRRPVAAIVASGPPSAFAARAATTAIPIVFLVGNDPVQLGLATSLSRPWRQLDGNQHFQFRAGVEAARTASRSATPRCANRFACKPGRCEAYRNSIE